MTSRSDAKGLKVGALGLISSIVIGVASTAPAYSLAAYVSPAYFLGKTLNRDTRVVVAEDPSLAGGLRLPDSAEPRIVVPEPDRPSPQCAVRELAW